MKGNCYIFGAGDRCAASRIPKISENDYVIAADGGVAWLSDLGVTPDWIVGDFDSLGYIPQAENVHLLPVEKDDTDMGVAVNHGLKLGYQAFFLFGGTGGRLDHTLGNFALLNRISEQGGRGYLISDEEIATVIRNCKLQVNGMEGDTFSCFPFGERAEGISIHGAKYEISDAALTNNNTLGVSNSFGSTITEISVKKGAVLIVGAFGIDQLIGET